MQLATVTESAKIARMKYTLLMSVLLGLSLGCGKGEDPEAPVMHLFDASKPADQKILAQLRIVVRKPVGNLTRGDLAKVKKLKVNDAGITDVSVFVELKNLEELILNKNEITDLTPLAKISGLEKLSVNFNKISNLAPVAKMEKLRELQIYYNEVSDLKPISDMQHLRVLWIMNNKISDLKPLYGLNNLVEVHLNDNKGLDYKKISGLYVALPKCKVNHNTRQR